MTLIARGGVLPNVEPYAAEHVVASLEAHGVLVMTEARPTEVTRDASGTAHIVLADGRVIDADELLVATGCRPNTGDVVSNTSDSLRPASWLWTRRFGC